MLGQKLPAIRQKSSSSSSSTPPLLIPPSQLSLYHRSPSDSIINESEHHHIPIISKGTPTWNGQIPYNLLPATLHTTQLNIGISQQNNLPMLIPIPAAIAPPTTESALTHGRHLHTTSNNVRKDGEAFF